MKVKCLVADDEPLARKLLISHISKISGLDLIREFGDAFEVNEFLRHDSVDLMFLDIQMPEMDAFQLIRSLKRPPEVILTTAHRNFAPEAFDANVIDYLLKPISFERVFKAVNKFMDLRMQFSNDLKEDGQRQFIYVKANRKLHKVFLADIIFIESLDEYIRIHMQGNVLISRENITSMEARLDRADFIRIHRSFLLSRRAITSISSDGVEIMGRILPFGRTYKMSALTALGLSSKFPPDRTLS